MKGPELKVKHKHLLRIEKCIDIAVLQENNGIFNFFEKSATKHQPAYRYSARKGKLTFFKTTH